MMRRAKTIGAWLRAGLPALVVCSTLVVAASGPSAAKPAGAPAPHSIPHGGGGDDDGDGGKPYVHVFPKNTESEIRARLERVAPGGMLIFHADSDCPDRDERSQSCNYHFSHALAVKKSVSIVAAKGDEGYVKLNFPAGSGCIEIGPLKTKRLSAPSPPSIPGGAAEEIAAPTAEGTPPASAEDGPTNIPSNGAEDAPPERAANDADMCVVPDDEKHASKSPTPPRTAALCGLRITRDEAYGGSDAASGRTKACISVYSSRLYMANTKIDAGVGSGLALFNAQVRMGTARPGGIDRAVGIFGLSNETGSKSYGIKVDRKSALLLQWTQVAGFGSGVRADGNIDLKRGVRIENNNIGLAIGGGQEDADIFGPRHIEIGVDDAVTSTPPGIHDDPEIKRPQIFDNDVGIQVGENFEGDVRILSADIWCKTCPSMPDAKGRASTGIDVLQSKYKSVISIRSTAIANQYIGIDASRPIMLYDGIYLGLNTYGIVFEDTYQEMRRSMEPYFLESISFANNTTDMNFQGLIDSDLLLCNIVWPKREWRGRGGLAIVAGASARFNRCFVDNPSQLRRSLDNGGRDIFFKHVCKNLVTKCPGLPR